MSPREKSSFETTEKPLSLETPSISNRDLPPDLPSHVFVHAEFVLQALVPAAMRWETIILFLSPLI